MPKYRLLTPGPVAVPERVRLAMAGPLPHHRTDAFVSVFSEVRVGLREVFQTQSEVLLLASTGTGAMEAAVTNTLAPGDRCVVVRGGKFGERWAALCETHGVEVVPVDVEWGEAVDPAAVRAAFARAPDARALLVQASETSTGVYHPIRELAELTHAGADRLVIVDGISAVGVHDLPMDEWGLDVVVSGSQKSWRLPPGLAFVALSPRAIEVTLANPAARFYFDLRRELASQPTHQTAWSPAISLILGLREALAMMLEEGLPAIFEHHARLARLTRAGARAAGLDLLGSDSPSHACTAIRLPEGVDGKALLRRLTSRYGVTLAGGQDRLAGRIVRVGHLGDVDEFDMMIALASLEMALADAGVAIKLGESTRAIAESMRTELERG